MSEPFFKSYSDACANNSINDDPFSRTGKITFFKALGPAVDQLEEEDFHIVTPAAKKIMFREHQPTLNAQKLIGKQIHERLSKMVPEVAKLFVVKDDPLGDMTFRLWAQRETEDSREDAYVALSYCWNTEPSAKDAKYPLPINPLMFLALAGERQWRTTGVWIDQLCIDQKNNDEKSISVAAMDTVYRCAQSVVIALLDIEVALAHQDFLREHIKDYESSTDGDFVPHLQEKPPFFEKHPVFKRFFNTVLGSRYFTRAWCTHELELATNLVFYIPCQTRHKGEEVTEMLSFTSTFLWYMLGLSTEVPGEKVHVEIRDKLLRKLDIPTRLKKRYDKLKGKKVDLGDTFMDPYTTQIRQTFSLGAGGDPTLPPHLRESSTLQDKMSIVLNILGTGLKVVGTQQINPMTEEEATFRLTVLSLAALDPTALCTLGKPFNLTPKTSELFWLCKPSWYDLGPGGQRREPLPTMSAKLMRYIRFDPSPSQAWVEVDAVALGMPRAPAEEFRQLASSLTQKGIELGLGRPPPGPFGDPGAEYAGKTDLESRLMLWTLDSLSDWGSGPLYLYWQHQTFLGEAKERFNWTVACILECGMSWMLGTAHKCGFTAISVLETRLRRYFKKNHFSGIKDMTWAETQTGRDAVDTIFAFANWAVSWGASGFFEKKKKSMPMLYNHGQNGNAMVFLPGNALTQAMIPCPLLSDEYGRLYRVWLLQAKDDPFYHKMTRGETPHWFLWDKTILFTDVEAKHTVVLTGSARDGLRGWRLREDVRVHGPP